MKRICRCAESTAYSQASKSHFDAAVIGFHGFQVNIRITPCFFSRYEQAVICNIRTSQEESPGKGTAGKKKGQPLEADPWTDREFRAICDELFFQ
jgi:hypothetical protein